MVSFTVPGPPQGKARARTFTTRSGKVRSCTPPRTAAYEAQIRSCFREALFDSGMPEPCLPKGTPVRIEICAYYRPAVRMTKKALFEVQHGLRFPLRKPDLDNVLKVVADALNGVAYGDDSQIVEIAARKEFSHEEGLSITVMDAKKRD